MPKKKQKIKKEKSKKEKPELREEIIAILEKKEETLDDEFDNEVFSGIEFSQEFRRMLLSQTDRTSDLENFNVPSGSLEKGIIFAPRMIIEKDETETKNYSDTKYESRYNENKYAEKTPGYAAKSESSDKGKSEKSKS